MYQNRNTTYVSRRRQSSSARTYSRNTNIARFEPSVKIGKTMMWLFVAGIFSTMFMIYLQNATKSNAYGSEIQEIDERIAESQQIKSDLEVENARLTSLNAIENSEVAQKMVKPNSINYAE